MRIIVTSKGEVEISSIPSPLTTHTSAFRRTHQPISNHQIKSSFTRVSSSTKSPSENKPKKSALIKFQLKKPKLDINFISEMYIYNKGKYSDQNFNTTSAKTQKHHITTISRNSNLSLKDVLDKKALSNMIARMKIDNMIKSKLSRVTHENFRSIPGKENESISDPVKIDNIIKQKHIRGENLNFIKYLSIKKELNPIILNHISKLSNDQIEKEDKICKVILKEKEKEDIYKNALINQLNHIKVNYPKELGRLSEKICMGNKIFQRYPMKKKINEAYREKHDDIDRDYWSKFNYERLLNTRKELKKIESDS